MMKKDNYYESLLGQSKSIVLNKLDHPITAYESDEWVYITGKNFLGFKKRLYLFFKNDHVYDYFTSSLA